MNAPPCGNAPEKRDRPGFLTAPPDRFAVRRKYRKTLLHAKSRPRAGYYAGGSPRKLQKR